MSHLTVLILESAIKLGQFDLHIVLDIFLLIADNLEYLIFELRLTLNLKLFKLVKHGVHQRRQYPHVLGRHLFTLLDIVFNISELLLKVVQTLQRFSDLLLLTLILLVGPMRDAEKLCIIHSLLSVRHLLKLCLLVCELQLNAYLTERLLFEHHDRLWEVNRAEVHLDSIREEWLHGHLRLSTLGFL